MTDDTLTILGWTLITAAIGTAIILALTWKQPRTRELLALPDPTPAVQDAIDETAADFDTHVDQALAVANPADRWRDRPHPHGVCGPCGGRVICFRDAMHALEHLYDHAVEAADLAAWEQEMTS